MSPCIIPFVAIIAYISILATSAGAAEVKQADAFARCTADGSHCSIGTKAVQMSYESKDGQFVLSSFRNKLTTPNREYVTNATAHSPFGVESLPDTGSFDIHEVWAKKLTVGTDADPADSGLKLTVKKGDLVGFSEGIRDDVNGAVVTWDVTLSYSENESYTASDDKALNQGPVWYYYTRAANTGSMDLMGEFLAPTEPGNEPARVATGYRAPFECSQITPTGYHILNSLDLIRVWKAPKDGTVTIRGKAIQRAGSPSSKVSVLRISEKQNQSLHTVNGWRVISATAEKVAVGGRPAVQLNITASGDSLTAILHVQAYPGTAILRQWVEIQNTSSYLVKLPSVSPVVLGMGGQSESKLTNYWMCGGTSRPNQGQLESAAVTSDYHRTLLGEKTDNYIPWMALQHSGSRDDGYFVTLDTLGTWTIGFDHNPQQSVLTSSLPEWTDRKLAAGESVKLPLATIGVFKTDLDDMGQQVYDWQYEYLWDFTNSEFYGRTAYATPWFFCSRNLQEQFAARLANLDMDSDILREVGIEMLWDDAGWSKYPGWPVPDNYGVVFSPSHEGPDYAETLRYLGKMDMKWLLWMAGRPSQGLMDTKIGSWGNFQWRTDGFGKFNPQDDSMMRAQIEHFLTANPRASFHTCDGGSRFAHQFEIQRYADVNYFSDMGRDDKTNHFFSLLELPDKWLDIIDTLEQSSKYNPDVAPRQLTMVPVWYGGVSLQDRESVRRLFEKYRYLREEGVVGRWSYMLHPVVKGDAPHLFDQRTSQDRTKACIIIKHKPVDGSVIYPQGLLAAHQYIAGSDMEKGTTLRSGADLMTKGISLSSSYPSRLIYLGLPYMPGTGSDTTAPAMPGQLVARSETNLGHRGVGLYWSTVPADKWISYYEVSRDGVAIGKSCVAPYYFDRSLGNSLDCDYAVRTVDGDGNVSAWKSLDMKLPGEDAYAALGGHFAKAGQNGWSAVCGVDGKDDTPMNFIPPIKNPAGDFGGTPNQIGGVEGYWEGAGSARIGRGWQQASAEVQCVRVWTSQKSGTVRILGRAMKECYHQSMGSALQVKIQQNALQIWPSQGWADVPLNDLVGATHDITVDVQKGDQIKFVLDRGSSWENDIIAWMPRIIYSLPQKKHAASSIRILCGAKSQYKDTTGNVWSADSCFNGGEPVLSKSVISNTLPSLKDQRLYQSGRKGKQFSYEIPVTPGMYSVRLKLAETQYQWSFERPMNLSINGRQLLRNFDVNQAVRGSKSACERVFRNIMPNADGKIVIELSGGVEPSQKSNEALLHAIEILPEIRQTIRIDAGSGKQFVDWDGFVWDADGSTEGVLLKSEAALSHAAPTLYDQTLYQTARSGKSLKYQLKATPGIYTVHLKFAEMWLSELGQRPMDIEINGKLVRSNWDPAQAAGQIHMAADIRVEDITPDSAGLITISLKAVGANDAILQAIEVE